MNFRIINRLRIKANTLIKSNNRNICILWIFNSWNCCFYWW